MDAQKYKKCYPKCFDFCKIKKKCAKKCYEIPNFFGIVLYCTMRRCSQTRPKLKVEIAMGATHPKSFVILNSYEDTI